MNERIAELVNFLLILIPSACAARCIYCLVFMSVNSDEVKTYRKRMINAIIFTVIAESIIGIYTLIASYFGGAKIG